MLRSAAPRVAWERCPAARPLPRPRPRRAAAVLLGGALLAGCVPPDGGASGDPGGALRRQRPGRHRHPPGRPQRARARAAPSPPGRRPAHLVAGPGGALLVLAAGTRGRARRGPPDPRLPRGRVAGRRAPSRRSRERPGTLLAGDGGARMVVAHHAPAGAGAGGDPVVCRLALLDARSGDVQRTHTLPPARLRPPGLPAQPGPGGRRRDATGLPGGLALAGRRGGRPPGRGARSWPSAPRPAPSPASPPWPGTRSASSPAGASGGAAGAGSTAALRGGDAGAPVTLRAHRSTSPRTGATCWRSTPWRGGSRPSIRSLSRRGPWPWPPRAGTPTCWPPSTGRAAS